MRTVFIALLGIAVLCALLFWRQVQPAAPQKMMVGPIDSLLAGDTGCWFRFPTAGEEDAPVFFTDAASGMPLKGLANINGRDFAFTRIAEGAEESVYFSHASHAYLLVHYGSAQKENKGRGNAEEEASSCPVFPSATLTFLRNQNSLMLPVYGECGCDSE